VCDITEQLRAHHFCTRQRLRHAVEALHQFCKLIARTGNSSDRHPFYERNRQELAAVQAMTASQIRQGVAAGRFRMR
jgi:hypothetical protein